MYGYFGLFLGKNAWTQRGHMNLWMNACTSGSAWIMGGEMDLGRDKWVQEEHRWHRRGACIQEGVLDTWAQGKGNDFHRSAPVREGCKDLGNITDVS